MWLSKLTDSKLIDTEMATLVGDLAGVLKGDNDKAKYLNHLNGLIEKFTLKVEEFEEDEKIWGKYAEVPKTEEGKDKID
jgi:hypothetical protein